MAVQIWNEGRVVGFSAYEIYLRQLQAIDPTATPVSEREWLASGLAMGSSMLLKVPAVTQDNNSHTSIDIAMPENSHVMAANTIVASFFDGDAVEASGWATRVTDYGTLISNTSTSSPNSTGSNVPTQTLEEWSDEKKSQLSSYMRIVDGIVIQPGRWSNNASGDQPPEKKLVPDITRTGTIRLHIKGAISNDARPWVLLTGFTLNNIVAGLSALDYSTATGHPEDGDFLGPTAFPWASKIVFSVPNSFISYFVTDNYSRSLPQNSTPISISDTPVIDMKAGSGVAGSTTPALSAPVLENYYATAVYETDDLYFPSDGTNDSAQIKQSARIPISVTGVATTGDGVAVLTVYQKSAIYPPALYGTFVDATGDTYLHPIDIVAPGSVKVFQGATAEQMQEYQQAFPGVTTINRTPAGELQVLNADGNLVSLAGVINEPITITTSDGSRESPIRKSKISTPGAVTLPISITRSADGTQLTIGEEQSTQASIGSTTTNVGGQNAGWQAAEPGDSPFIAPATSNMSWNELLNALAGNKPIDILGNNMKILKAGLSPAASGDTPYFQLPNGLRLYISATVPRSTTTIPVGSIGIGWQA